MLLAESKEPGPIDRERPGDYRLGESSGFLELATVSHPDTDVPVLARGEDSPGGQPYDGLNAAAVPTAGVQSFTGSHAPAMHDTVIAARDDGRAAGTEGHAFQAIARREQAAVQLAGFQVPDTHRFAPTDRGDVLTVRGNRQALYMIRVDIGQAMEQLGVGEVPDEDRPLTPSDQPPIVRREGKLDVAGTLPVRQCRLFLSALHVVENDRLLFRPGRSEGFAVRRNHRVRP